MEFLKNEHGYYVPQDEVETKVSYPDQGNAGCYAIEEESQWFNARNRTISWALTNFPFKGTFADIGGGNGYQLSYLQAHYFNVNNTDSLLCEPGHTGCLNAVKRGVENVYCATAEQLDLRALEIGGIGLFDVIEHIEDDRAFMKMMAAQVDRGTLFYITVPAFNSLWSKEDHLAGHFRRYNRRNTLALAQGTGLKIVFQSYFFSYYFFPVWLLRVVHEAMNKNVSSEEIAEREKNHHNQSRWTKSILNAFHGLEVFMMKLGVRIPFGTSRLIILEKS